MLDYVKCYVLRYVNTPRKVAIITNLMIIIAFPLISEAADIKTVVNNTTLKIYEVIAGVSTAIALLVTAIAALVCRMSKNTKQVEEGWEWIKRVWGAWAIINALGAISSFVGTLDMKGSNWGGEK